MHRAIGVLLYVFCIICCRTDATPSSWYIGCYSFTSARLNSAQLLFRDNNLTPAKCSKTCLGEKYEYALLSEDRCFCDRTLSGSTEAEDTECDISCFNDVSSFCGGANSFSVYSKHGPFISNVDVNIYPSKAVAGEKIKIKVKIKIASNPDFPTGLESYNNVTFDRVNVVVQVESLFPTFHVVDIVGREGSVEVVHTLPRPGFQVIIVEARNALSVLEVRNYLQVVSKIPRQVTLTDVTFHQTQPSCTPNDFNNEEQSLDVLESTSVLRGETVTLRAKVTQGVNVTFDWNFCRLSSRSSNPHQNNDNCLEVVCQTDEQTFRFNQSGRCEVIVNVHNNFGSALGAIYVSVIAPEIKDLSMEVSSCEDPTCQFSLPTWLALPIFPPIEGDNENQSSNNLLPPWFYDELQEEETTTSAPPTVQTTPNLPPLTYYVDTKVCFHARVDVTLRLGVKARVEYGDGSSLLKRLSNSPDRFFENSPRFKRFSGFDPYTSNLDPQETMTGRNSGLFPFTDNEDSDEIDLFYHDNYTATYQHGHGESSLTVFWDFSVCYNEGCSLNMYFWHKYQAPGEYNIEIQISNATNQITARLNQPITIVNRRDSSSRRMRCEALVASGVMNEFEISSSPGRTHVWLIAHNDLRNLTNNDTLFEWSTPERIISESPLVHTFTAAGVYNVRIAHEEEADSNSAYCNIVVEEPIDTVNLEFQPSSRYVSTDDVIHADLNVGKGSNFSVSWQLGDQVFSSDVIFNAPFHTVHAFRPMFVGCQNLSVVVANTVSRVVKVGRSMICSEEKISGLNLDVPENLQIRERANMTISLTNGSNVDSEVTIYYRVGAVFFQKNTLSGNSSGAFEYNILSPPFLEPGTFLVSLRARNRVTVSQNGVPRLTIRKRILVENGIHNISVQIISRNRSSFALNNEDNVLVLVLDDAIPNSSNILYKWTFPNESVESHMESHYTASPTSVIRPRCNVSLSGANCSITVTAIYGARELLASVNVSTNMEGRINDENDVNHPVVLPLGQELSLDVNCSHNALSCCKVSFSDTNATGQCLPPATNRTNHTFSEIGLWKITQENSANQNESLQRVSYISVQERLTGLRIKEGNIAISLNENPTGSWEALTEDGSHLVFQWRLRKQGQEGYLDEFIGVNNARKFGYVFNESGYYDVIVDVFNDVSHMQVSKTVEVRRLPIYFNVTVKPAYMNTISLFSVSTNVSGFFVLSVMWSQGGVQEHYTKEQLNIVDSTTEINSNIVSYMLPYLYQTSGVHNYRFVLNWEVNEDTLSKEISGNTTVYDINENPPVVLSVRKNKEEDSLNSPYFVALNDSILVEIKSIDLVTSLNWMVTNNGSLVTQNNVSDVADVMSFHFVASRDGTYLCNVTSNPGQLSFVIKVFVSVPITRLVLDRPYSVAKRRFVEVCELRTRSRVNSPCTVQFAVKSDGMNITYKFGFQRIGPHSEDDIISYVVANASNTIFPEHSAFKHAANVIYTFKREGAYNVTVTAYSSRDKEHQNVPLMVTSLDSFFYVESFPNVSLPQKQFFAEVGNLTKFKLKQKNRFQTFKIDWAMGDGTAYKDAGLAVEHIYQSSGNFFMHILIYNNLTQAHLRPRVVAEARLLDVEITTQSRAYRLSTQNEVSFEAHTLPPNAATSYIWYLSNDNQTKKTYYSSVNYLFKRPGGYLVKVVAKNSINSVESFPKELTLIEPVKRIAMQGPSTVKVNDSNRYRAFYLGGSDVKCNWNMGDGTEVFDSVNVTHVYSRTGVYKVTLTVGNSFNSLTTSMNVFAMKQICSQPQVFIPNNGFGKYYRSKTLWFETKVTFNCSLATGVAYHWTVTPRRRADFGQRQTIAFESDKKLLRIPAGTLSPDNYKISVNVSLIGTILHKTAGTYITIEESKVVAAISDGFSRLAFRSSSVEIDASESYDPNNPDTAELSYQWECFVLNDPYAACFKNESTHVTTPSPNMVPSSALRELPRRGGREYDPSVHSWFPPNVGSNSSTLKFQAAQLVEKDEVFIFKVNISNIFKPQSSSDAIFVLKVTGDPQTVDVSIDCPGCEESFAIKHLTELFVANCTNCDGGRVHYTWKVALIDDGSTSFYKYDGTDCAPLDGSGWMELTVNTSSNATLTREQIRLSELAYLEALRNRTSNVSQIDIHPDDANFTGIIPDDTLAGNELISPYHSRSPVILPLGFTGELPYENLTGAHSIYGQNPFSPPPLSGFPDEHNGIDNAHPIGHNGLSNEDDQLESGGEYVATDDSENSFSSPLLPSPNPLFPPRISSSLRPFQDTPSETLPSMGFDETQQGLSEEGYSTQQELGQPSAPEGYDAPADDSQPFEPFHPLPPLPGGPLLPLPGGTNLREASSAGAGRLSLPEGVTGSRYTGQERGVSNPYWNDGWQPYNTFGNNLNPVDTRGSFQELPDHQLYGGEIDLSPSEHNSPPGGGRENTGGVLDSRSHYSEGDSFIDASLPAVHHMPDHYQNLKHIPLRLDDVAEVINDKQNMLIIKPNTLEEGKIYSVKATITHTSENGQVVKHGEASHYFRVMRGPSYGNCAIVNIHRNDTFRVHCFQFKNIQSNKLDTLISQDEILFTEISYKMSEYGEERALYYGPSYEWDFQLPHSQKPVYVRVTLHNSQRAETEICTIPVNSIRPERNRNSTALDDVDYVYSKCVGKSCALQLLIMKRDENGILGFGNTLIDSIPPVDNLMILISTNPVVEDKLRNITSHLSEAFVRLRTLRLAGGVNILSALRRLLQYEDFFSVETISVAIDIIKNVFADAARIEEKNDGNSYIENLAKHLKNQPFYEKAIHEALLCLENLVSVLRRKTNENNERETLMRAVDSLSTVERSLNSFFLEFYEVKFNSSKLSTISTSNIHMFAQNMKRNSFVKINNASIGAYLPSIASTDQPSLTTFLFVAYLKENPLISTQHQIIPKLDTTALSVCVLDEDNNPLNNLNSSMIVSLPVRMDQQRETLDGFHHHVDRDHVMIHVFNATYADNSTLHIDVLTDKAINRDFTVAVAISKSPPSTNNIPNGKTILKYGSFSSRRKSGKSDETRLKFTFEPQTLPHPGTYYLSLWSTDSLTLVQRKRLAHQRIGYGFNVWWSDCYYWDRKDDIWDNNDCKTLDDSTISQTRCSASVISTFTSTYEKVDVTTHKEKLAVTATTNSFTTKTGILFGFLAITFLLFLAINKYILGKRNGSSGFDYSDFPPGVSDWMRCWFGTDDRGEDGRVPVILRDNKAEHNQVFEITVQTGSWPGSGTTSLVYVILHGKDGNYEARELSSPSSLVNATGDGMLCAKDCLFETGSTKTFITTFEKSLGPLTGISIWHNHTGRRPRWFLDYVIISDVMTGEKSYFSYRSWLAFDNGLGRISVDLLPLKDKPKLLTQLALRAQNYMLDLHSVLSIFVCARWGRLSRTQRITHCFTLWILLLALSAVKYWVFLSSDASGDDTFPSYESVLWGLIIAIAANALLAPAQLILRNTKKDERISVTMEDITYEKSSLKSFSRIDFHDSNDKVGGGGLHKTFATTHGLPMDDVIDYAMPYRNEVVSDWLRTEIRSNSSESAKDFERLDNGDESLRSFPLRQSFCSTDDEIARCMTSSPTSYASGYQSYRVNNTRETTAWQNDTSVSDVFAAKQCNYGFGSIACDEENAKFHLAMDGPELVPCEKLDPIPDLGGGPLPRSCAYLAMIYYVLVLVASSVAIFLMPGYVSDFVDDEIWVETALFSAFWSLLVVEMLFVLFSTLISALKEVFQDPSLLTTLHHLFPTVDAATVDDFVYKSEAELQDNYILDDVTSVALDPKEIDIRVSERQRCRYLRNISTPYDSKGRWRCKDGNDKKKRKLIRKSAAARRACSSWINFFFLLVFLLVAVGLFLRKNGEKYSQTAMLNQMFKDGFGVDEKLFICGKERNKTKETTSFDQITDFLIWNNWIQSNLLPQIRNPNLLKSDIYSVNCNNIILNSIQIIKVKRKPEDGCKNLPLSMQKLLADTKYCNRTINKRAEKSNAGVASHEVNFLDLSTLADTDTKFNADGSLEKVEIEFVVYNKVSCIYSLVKALSSFSNPFLKQQVSIQSVYLSLSSFMSFSWLLPIYLPLLIWVICHGLSGILLLLEKRSWSQFRGRNGVAEKPFQSGSLKLVDFFLWIIVVAYLCVSSVYRFNISKSAETLEKSGHLLKDPETIIESVIMSENGLRLILGFWSIMLALKLTNIATFHHGFQSKLVRGITAVSMSLKHTFLPCLRPFFVISLIITLTVSINNFFRYDTAVAWGLLPKSVFTLWYILTGKATGSLTETLPFLNSGVSLFYLITIFILTRVLLKGFLIASYQWYLRKSQNRSSRFEALRKKRKNELFLKQDKRMKKAKWINHKTASQISDKFSQSRSFNQHVTFKELFEEIVHNLRQFFSVCCSTLIYLSSRICGCSCHSIWRCIKLPNAYQESNDTDSTQNLTNPDKEIFKECEYDKTKLDEDYFMSDIAGNFDSNPSGNISKKFDYSKASEMKCYQSYNLPVESAFPEFELQVDELTSKASSLFKEETAIFLQASKSEGLSVDDPDSQVLSIVVKLIIDQILLARRRRSNSEDDVITNASSLTSLAWSSPRSSFDGSKLVKLKESIKKKDSIQKIEETAGVQFKNSKVHYEPTDPNCNVADSALDSKMEKTDQQIDLDSADKAKECESVSLSSRISLTRQSLQFQEENLSFSTLTTTNIARHNQEHQLKRTLSSRQSSASKKRTLSSTLKSSSGKSLEETTGRRSSQSGSSIWKSLFGIRKKAMRKKSRPVTARLGTLRRSETIFIDVRDLPVFESDSTLSGGPKKVLPVEQTNCSSETDAQSFQEPYENSFKMSGENSLFSSSNELGDIAEDLDELPRNLPGYIDEEMGSLQSFSNAACSNPKRDVGRHHTVANVEAKWRLNSPSPSTNAGKPRVIITRLSRSSEYNS